MADELKYNGYTFGPHTHIHVSAQMVEDDAGRTIVYHRYNIRVETTIVAEAGDRNVGAHFRRIRQLLSKQGAGMVINHAGFGPRLEVNLGSGGVRDVAFGPKPRVITWEPVGATNAVEVVWECELSLPTCEGQGGVRFTGISAINYSVTYHVDRMGYTTRTVSGYLEIAMTRFGRNIPDTADAYRERILIPKPNNFERESTWNLSLDKRRVDFSIVDTEIKSPNAYPPGVIHIRANHRVGWSRRSLATLPNTISATITLAPNQPRGLAWSIFRGIVASRISFAGSSAKVFLEALDVDEELYENQISFSASYRLYVNPKVSALGGFFDLTGLFSPPPGNWSAHLASMESVQTPRGRANLYHRTNDDQIIDLCSDSYMPQQPAYYSPNYVPPTAYQRFCNVKPPPYESWLRYEGAITSVEESPAVEQVTVGADDLRRRDFDPSDPTGANGLTVQGANIERYVESAPAGLEFEWAGYAERVGYDIPKPDKLTFGNVTLIRKGKGIFRKKLLGTHFCQPLVGAAWKMRYVVAERPASVSVNSSNEMIEGVS